MEDCSEEEYEYFETVEDISSTTDCDSDSEGEDLRFQVKQLTNQVKKPPWGTTPEQPRVFLADKSRYTVWKNHPKTIRERRRELFQLMGIQDNREYCNESISSDASLGISVLTTELDEKTAEYSTMSVSQRPPSVSSPVSSESSEVTCSFQNAGCYSDMNVRASLLSHTSGGLGRSASLAEVCTKVEPSRNIARTRSDGRVRSRRPPPPQPSLGFKSGSATPDMAALERMYDMSGAVLREANAHSRTQLSTGRFRDMSLDQDLWSDPSSSSEQSLLDISQSGEDSMEDRKFSADLSKELICRVKDLDTGKEFVVHELGTDGLWNKLKEVSTGRELTFEEFERSLGLSPVVKEVRKREWAAQVERKNDINTADVDEAKHKKKGWLRSFKNVAKYIKVVKEKSIKDSTKGDSLHKVASNYEAFHLKDKLPFWQPQKVKVRAHRKASKEFSDLYMGQDFRAHQGPIWTLKFSRDGHYLATGGQDCVVRIWEVKIRHSAEDVESNFISSESSDLKIGEMRSTSGLRNLLSKGDGKHNRVCSLGRSKNENAKVIQLPKVFLITEKPVCCFHGHTKDVLDLAWSPSQFIVSSSVDKTVRLWHILHEGCLKIFLHRDYVTCVEFNPVDDRYFLSGSLDDKIRIWSIIDHQVVDWVDVREMVTAACYKPDGKGAVVGSYKGTCRIYKIAGDKLEIEDHMNVVNSKGKKLRGKKITGLQYMPGDPCKLLVTSSDSRIRLYDGLELHSKRKGFRNANSQISASFSTQGNYIVSASEDSHVYIWNTGSSIAQKGNTKSKNHPYEGFYCQNVTAAICWPGTAPPFSVSHPSKEDSEIESLRQSSERFSPYDPKDHIDSENSVFTPAVKSDVSGFSSGSSNGKVTSKFSKALNRGESGNDLESVTQMYGTQTSLENGKWADVWCSDGVSPCQDLAASLFPNSLLGQESLSRNSTSLNTSERNSRFFIQPPVFDKVCGCDSVLKASATWPEEKLLHSIKFPPQISTSETSGSTKSMTAANSDESLPATVFAVCDLVIVAASFEGDLRTFQNYRVV